ncbi:MAG: hypothetical protein KAS12_06685 [Candidatus Aenigmarchaeota archaeon]|nr:hypothetical protein [Candidatus Aenigmarchaeota archaeon]
MINDKLKNEFINVIKKTFIKDNIIKIRLEVSKYIDTKIEQKENMDFILENLQKAVKEVNNDYFVVESLGYGATEGKKEIIFEATIIYDDGSV